MFLEVIKSVIFGIVEGITEWLPISSTGHLILVEQFLKFKEVSPEFWNMFQVVIQLRSNTSSCIGANSIWIHK